VKNGFNIFSPCFYLKMYCISCRRSKYTTDDEKAILCGLLHGEHYKRCGSNSVWKEFEKLKVLYVQLQHLLFCACMQGYSCGLESGYHTHTPLPKL